MRVAIKISRSCAIMRPYFYADLLKYASRDANFIVESSTCSDADGADLLHSGIEPSIDAELIVLQQLRHDHVILVNCGEHAWTDR